MSGASPSAAVLVEALERYGVEHVFGNPGTTELPVLRAISDSDLEYVLAPHEDVAVGAAAGYATVLRDRIEPSDAASSSTAPNDLASSDSASGTPAAASSTALPLGVVNLHLTAGVAHGLGNLYGAWMAGAPLLVTAGTHSLSFRHEEPILSGDLRRHVEPYTKYAAEVTDADALPSMVRRAVRTALTPPTGPVFLGLPMDVAEASTSAEPERLGTIPTAGPGDPAALDSATDLLEGAEETVLLVGDGVARAGTDAVDAATALADALGARVHGEVLSAAVDFPREHDLWASVLPTSADAIRDRLDADAIVLAGSSTNTTLLRHEDSLLSGDPALVHLGADATALGKRLPADVAAVGDPEALLSELADRVRSRLPPSVRSERRADAADRAEAIRSEVQDRGVPGAGKDAEAGDAEEDPEAGDTAGAGGADEPRSQRPSPAELVEAVEATTPNAVVVDEGISAKYALLARWDLGHGDFHSNKGGCLGYGLPAAVGAALAEGDRSDGRPVVGFVGDGSYLYYPQSIRAAVRADVDLVVIVPNNQGYGSVAHTADELFDAGADAVPGLAFDDPVDVAANAESHGALGLTVERTGALEDALESAREHDGVAVVDVRVRD